MALKPPPTPNAAPSGGSIPAEFLRRENPRRPITPMKRGVISMDRIFKSGDWSSRDGAECRQRRPQPPGSGKRVVIDDALRELDVSAVQFINPGKQVWMEPGTGGSTS